ncbi:MAG: hypothetical protein ACI9OJ_005808, partial [Myxococcota bacterium]
MTIKIRYRRPASGRLMLSAQCIVATGL